MKYEWYSYVKDHIANTWFKFNDYFVKEVVQHKDSSLSCIDQIMAEATGENEHRSAYFLGNHPQY